MAGSPGGSKPQIISRDDVERRVLRAILTLAELPDRETGWHRVKAMWPGEFAVMASLIKTQIMRPDKRKPRLRLRLADLDDFHVGPEDHDPLRRRFQPTQADVSDCLVALGWWARLHVVDQVVVSLVARDFDFRSIGRRAEHEAFRILGAVKWFQRYDRGPDGQSDDWARERYDQAIAYCLLAAEAQSAAKSAAEARHCGK